MVGVNGMLGLLGVIVAVFWLGVIVWSLVARSAVLSWSSITRAQNPLLYWIHIALYLIIALLVGLWALDRLAM